MTWQVVAGNAAVVAMMMAVLWLVSVAKRDASIVDPWWSMGFFAVTVRTAVATGWTVGKVVVASVVGLWAVRLWLHLLVRSRGRPEDPRYAAFRARYGPQRYWWVSALQVFALQGALIVVISAPLQWLAVGAMAVDWLLALGAGVALAGALFEAVADAQLQRFRNEQAHIRTRATGGPQPSQVMDRGLWRYSRHPNYFGEAVTWWGFGIMALSVQGGWWTLWAPALMTWLLVRVSGVAMLDAHLHKTRPGFAEYCARTSAFVPRRPRA